MIKKYWNRFLHWCGWKAIFPLPAWAEILLFFVCMAGLVWVFWNRLEQWWPAYFLYGVSAYALVAVLFRIPGAVRGTQMWLEEHPKVAGILRNREWKFSLKLHRR